MNLFKHITFVILIIIPINIFSQNLSVAEINSNSKIMSRAWIDVVSPDNSPFVGLFGNPALLTADKEIGITASHMDWFPKVDNLSYRSLSSYFSLNNKLTLGVGYKTFLLKNIAFTDESGRNINEYNLNEGEVKFAGGYKLNRKFSLGLAINVLYYSLSPDDNSSSFLHASFDIGFNYADSFKFNKYKVNYGYAASINSIGSDFESNLVSQHYMPTNKSTVSLPTQMKLGGYITPTFEIDENSSLDISLIYQASKYLTTTFATKGKTVGDDEYSYSNGMLRSTNDSSDNILGEITHSLALGLNYTHSDELKMTVNLGRQFEHKDYGGRNFNTFGFEIEYKKLSFGVSKISTLTQNDVLDDVTCYTLSYIYKLN